MMNPLVYLSLVLFGGLLVGPFLDGVHAQNCTSGSLDYNNKQYCYIHEELSRDVAEHWCNLLGGVLAMLDCDAVPHAVPKEIVQYLEQQQNRSESREGVWIEAIQRENSNGEVRIVCTELYNVAGFSGCYETSCLRKLPALCEMNSWAQFPQDPLEGVDRE